MISPNAVLCFLPWFASFQNDFQHSSQKSLHSHWQACRRKTNCLETFILLSSLPIISTKAEKLQSGRQMTQTCRVFASFLPTRKHLFFSASKCTSLLLHSPDAQEQPQNLSQEKIPSSHSSKQFRTACLFIKEDIINWRLRMNPCYTLQPTDPKPGEKAPTRLKGLCEVRGEVRSSPAALCSSPPSWMQLVASDREDPSHWTKVERTSGQLLTPAVSTQVSLVSLKMFRLLLYFFLSFHSFLKHFNFLFPLWSSSLIGWVWGQCLSAGFMCLIHA